MNTYEVEYKVLETDELVERTVEAKTLREALTGLEIANHVGTIEILRIEVSPEVRTVRVEDDESTEII